ISIEAKLKNWKKAIEQATLNTSFASESYILIPEKKKRSLDSFHDMHNPGLITFNGEKAKVYKKAKNSQLPVSYYSWIINEHVATMINNDRE
ncbi:MAG: hypothetical protein KDE33_19615, partial [Bacteroidetes bacterium]|nr:hypothetical protein [Bacteroidota bacterium]